MDYKKDTKDTAITNHRVQGGMETFSITLPKKCERLSTAVYLITNFLSDIEPIKYRLRTLSIDFVRDAFLVKNGSYIIETNVLDGLRANILETLSLLELAFVSGLVSEMNFTILKREYILLRSTIEIKKASRESRTDNILGDNFFGLPTGHDELLQARASHENISAHTSSKGHSIRQTNITMSDTSRTTPSKPQGQTLVAAQNSLQKESRRERILKLVKDNREVTIKDISSHFVNLSEKTIQRELVALVEEGVLKKLGERRWSRYSLV